MTNPPALSPTGPPYSPEQMIALATLHEESIDAGCITSDAPCGPCIRAKHVAAMLRQAAAQARVLAGLRQWLAVVDNAQLATDAAERILGPLAFSSREQAIAIKIAMERAHTKRQLQAEWDRLVAQEGQETGQ